MRSSARSRLPIWQKRRPEIFMRTVFFIQQSPALAGSQKSLLRLMQSLGENWKPVLVTGSEGWLTSETRYPVSQ